MATAPPAPNNPAHASELTTFFAGVGGWVMRIDDGLPGVDDLLVVPLQPFRPDGGVLRV